MLKRVCLLVLLMSLLIAPVAIAQSGSGSTLEQQIVSVGCNFTTIETGMGVVHASTCPVFAPKIERISPNRGRPILKGIYDAAHALVFRIRIADSWYVLGKHSELTATGNVWELNLSTLESPLPEGTYAVIVEMQATDGSLLQIGGAVAVEAMNPPQGGDRTDTSEKEGDKDDKDAGGQDNEPFVPPGSEQQPISPEETTKQSFLIPLIVVLVGSGIVLLVAVLRRRRYRGGDS